MEDLSLHILDIMQNSAEHGADTIVMRIEENTGEDLLTISILDNGSGMDESAAAKVTDPFYTSKEKRVGLGVPLFKQAALTTGGSFSIDSQAGKGTVIEASFAYSNIDRQPLGHVVDTVISILIAYPRLRIVYTHVKDGQEAAFDSEDFMERAATAEGGTAEYAVLCLMKGEWESRLGEIGAGD